MATVENKANIEDLKALVEELNAASKSAIVLPRSVVVDQNFCTISDVKAVNADVVEAVEAVSAFEAPEAKELCFPIVRF